MVSEINAALPGLAPEQLMNQILYWMNPSFGTLFSHLDGLGNPPEPTDILRTYLRGATTLQGCLSIKADLKEGGAKAPHVCGSTQATGSSRQALRSCPGNAFHPLWGAQVPDQQEWKGQGKAIPVPSPTPELTLPGEGSLAHTRIT